MVHGAGLVAEDTSGDTQELLTRWFELSQEERSQLRICALQCFKRRFDCSTAARSLAEVLEH